jgi:hypothetical protein
MRGAIKQTYEHHSSKSSPGTSPKNDMNHRPGFIEGRTTSADGGYIQLLSGNVKELHV